ncbi:MAG TPA: SusC/RagA family TonB-linked outer membrane protein [Gemmatimonadaceae bacterium]|nr:SusC/RagA family TonB-linked outer membrane protein [Gemmatimonadaceae bacterium]
MRARFVSTGLSFLTMAVALAFTAHTAKAQTGSINGRVTDAVSRNPVVAAAVQVVGTTRGASTAEDGTYRIPGLAAGNYQLRVLRLGYQASSKSVSVGNGATATADFTLSPVAVSLNDVVTTATGETARKREIGSNVTTLQPKQPDLATAQSVSQLLSAHVPGVNVIASGGTIGSGSRIRIRGANSISLTNEPLVIIDGIRFGTAVGADNTSGATSIGVGGQVPSRINDINPEDIASIEVLKGPAAAAQYGTAAANGVLQITTKRGRVGKPRWNVFAEGGTIRDVTTYPANWAQVGKTTAGARTTACSLDNQTRNLCTPNPDSLVHFSPLDAADPFIDGHRGAYGASVSGGTDAIQYYLAGNYDRQQGVFEISQEQRAGGRANLSVQVRPNWTVQLGTSYLADHLRLPQNDNNTLGIISAALLGRAFDDAAHGFLNNQVPQAVYAINTRQDVQRFENTINSSIQPLKWLTATVVGGLDYLDRYDNEVVPPAMVTFGSLPDGQRNSNPYKIYNYSSSATLSAKFTPFDGLISTTKASGAFQKELVKGTRAFGAKLVAGTGSLSGATARFAVGETNTDNKTVSELFSEDLAWRDRLYLSAALRNDKNSAFGKNFGSIVYPSAAASWVVNEEGFFPTNNILNSLRLRAAIGKSGQKPQFRDAITFFNAQTVTQGGTDVAGIVVGGTGNPDLKPERSKETELGFDAGFFGERIGFELTHYNKTTDDLLVAVPLAPSLGLTTTQFKNLGTVTNKGWEYSVNAKVVDLQQIGFDIAVAGSTNKNMLVSLGLLPTGAPVPPIVVNTQQLHKVGYSPGSYFQRGLTFSDANNDGIIARSEVTLTDTAVYLGNPLARQQYTVTPNLRLTKWLQIAAVFDHKGDYMLFNNTLRFRCSFNNCQEAYDKTMPLAAQAANIAIALGSDAGFIEDATYTKLRELSFTFSAPSSFAQAVRASSLTFTIAGRNLKTWTDFGGLDPDINASPGTNFTSQEFLTLPPTRNWTARINVGF